MAGKVKVALASPSGNTISVLVGLLYDEMVGRSSESAFRFFSPPSCQKAMGECYFRLLSGYPPGPLELRIDLTLQVIEPSLLIRKARNIEIELIPVDISLQDTSIVYDENCRLVLLVLDANCPDPSGADRSIDGLLKDIPGTSRLEIVMIDLTDHDATPPSDFYRGLDRWELRPFYIRLKGETSGSGSLRPAISERIGRELTYNGAVGELLDLLCGLGKIDNRRRHS